MSPFLIFLIIVTLGYVIYYAAIITIDMNAKPKDSISSGETMETPDGMQGSEEDDDSEEETTSREADDDNDDDIPERSNDGTGEDYQNDDNQGTDINEVPPAEAPFGQELHPSYTEPSPEEDDDVYGIDKQMNEESISEKEETQSTLSEEKVSTPSSEEPLPSNQEESTEVTSDPIKEADTESEQTLIDETDTDEDIDEEDLEAAKERMRQHLAQVAQAEGAKIVDAVVPDDSEFEEAPQNDDLVVMDSDNYDTGRADEINESNESIITESITPIRQDLFAPTIFGAFNRMKQDKKNAAEPPTINADNIVKEEHITKA